MNDKKYSTRRAMESYLDRLSKQDTHKEPARKNQAPEKEFSKRIVPYLKSIGFSVVSVESKAVFSESIGRYMHGQAKAGTADLLACSPCGHFCAVELKAPGRRSTLKSHQRDFLVQIISNNGFACVTDSIEHFHNLWTSWSTSKNKEILMADLPNFPGGTHKEDQPLFD